MTSTTGQLPAVVTILDLGSATLPLDSTMVFEAVQSSNGTMISVQVPLTAIMTTVQGALPTGGGTGQILNKTNANNYSTQWSSITQFVAMGTGLATSGSATSIVASLATQTGLSVLGVAGTGTLAPAAIVGTAGQVLRVDDGGTTLAFGPINLTSAVTGVISVPHGGTNTSTLTANGILFGNGTSTVGITAAGGTSLPLLGQGAGNAPIFGVLPPAGGGAGTSSVFTQGSVIFAGTSGIYDQDNTVFFWDNANNRLGIGTLAPAVAFHVNGTGTAELLRVESTGAQTSINILSHIGGGNFGGNLTFSDGTTTSLQFKSIANGGLRVLVVGTSQFVINSVGKAAFGADTNPQARLIVSDNATATGISVPAGAVLSVVATDAATTILSLENYGTLGNEFIGRAAGGTASSPSVVVTSAPLAAFGARGYTGSGFATSNNAKIGVFASQQWNATSFGTHITFETTPIGTTTRTEMARVTGTGVAIGTSGVAPDGLLTINANVTTVSVAAAASNYFHIIGADAAIPRINMDGFGGAVGPVFAARFAKGTAGGMSAVTTGDVIFTFGAFGAQNSTAYGAASQISFNAAEPFNATSNGQYISLITVQTASAAAVEAVRVQGSRGISIATTTDPGTGAIIATGKATLLSGTALSSTATAVLLCGSIASFGIYIGTGVPAVNAGTGSLFLRNDGATATSRMYVNTNGTGTWTAVNTVA